MQRIQKNSSTSMKMYENEQKKKSAIGSIVPECVALLLQKKRRVFKKIGKENSTGACVFEHDDRL